MIKPPGLWPRMADPTHLHTCFPLGPGLPASSPASAKGTATKPERSLRCALLPLTSPQAGSATPGQSGLLKSTYVPSFLSCFRGWPTTKQAEPPSSASLRTRNVGGHSHARPQVGPHSATTGAPLGHCHVTRDRAPRGPGAVVSGRRLRASGLRLADAFR